MISLPLFKRNMISAFKLSIIFIAILAMYTSMVIYMFDPSLADMLNQYQEMIPGVMNAIGMSGDSSTLISFINTYLYGFIMFIFPLIFEIILINKLIMKYIDSGSMACLLATPNSRKKIILTQLLSILLSITILIIITSIIGLSCSEIMFKGELDIPKYIQLSISVWLLHLALSSVGFFSACFFNEYKGYFMIGAGLPVLFYLINMLANMGGNLENLKYFTIFTLFPGKDIIQGISSLPSNMILLSISLLLYILGAIKFIKKDLPL